jgi:hypothetical protein
MVLIGALRNTVHSARHTEHVALLVAVRVDGGETAECATASGRACHCHGLVQMTQ